MQKKEMDELDELILKDTVRVNLNIPKKYMDRIDEYVKTNKIKNRKVLLEMIIIKYALKYTKGDNNNE